MSNILFKSLNNMKEQCKCHNQFKEVNELEMAAKLSFHSECACSFQCRKDYLQWPQFSFPYSSKAMKVKPENMEVVPI
jgi:hypothetical protein